MESSVQSSSDIETALETLELNSEATSEADDRIAAVRLHLREIHEEEKVTRELDRQQNSLSSRIEKLIGRV